MSQNPKKSYLLPEWKEEDYRQMKEWLQRRRITEVEFLILAGENLLAGALSCRDLITTTSTENIPHGHRNL